MSLMHPVLSEAGSDFPMHFSRSLIDIHSGSKTALEVLCQIDFCGSVTKQYLRWYNDPLVCRALEKIEKIKKEERS